MDETPDQGKSYLAEGLTPLHLSGCWRHVTSQASFGLKVSRNGGLVFRFTAERATVADDMPDFWKPFGSGSNHGFDANSTPAPNAGSRLPMAVPSLSTGASSQSQF